MKSSPPPNSASLFAALAQQGGGCGGSGSSGGSGGGGGGGGPSPPPEGAGGAPSPQSAKLPGLATLQEVPDIPVNAPSALPSPLADRRNSWDDLRHHAEGFNGAAVQHLREGNIEEAIELLRRAQALLDQWEEPVNPTAASAENRLWLSLQADTAGNFGIYYRKIGEPKSAVQSLQRALQFHSAAGSGLRTVAAVHLNLATCLLEAGAPAAESLRQAQAAVDLGGQLLAAPVASGSSAAGEGDEEGEGAVTGPSADDCAMLAVAYHKLAESYECAREWSRASHAYTQAYEVVRRSLGPHHHLTKAFEKSSRCPRRNIQVPSLPLTTARLTTPRRLPSIPRTRPAISQQLQHQQRAAKYEITGEVFARWPPENASKEERQWYRMVTKR
mmetsp:Transcript_86735/g.225315  ORF Transcript_86735/g.225315 Transcript_86735/m.225315 type:complete len:387 (-) Transcript_86735:37-1197(-)